ncbi:hypothetical protein SAVIM338S_06450 [Streptomyces avidinii]
MTPDHRLFPWRGRRQDGFTLIELLVVIVILGVLAAIVVFSVRGIGDKGRKSAVAADAATLRTAEESYCAKHGHYGTVDDLKAEKLLSGEPSYNMVAVGEENKCGRGEKSSFTLYDTSPTVRAADPVPVGENPADLAVDEKANRIYVVSTDRNTVTVIDGKTDQPIGSAIDVSGAVTSPTRIAVNPDSGQVYVGGTRGVAIIDPANGNKVTYVSNFTTTVSGLAVSPENGDVYVGGGASTVAYIAAGTSSATPIPLPAGGLVPATSGMDFSFDSAHHAVYFAKSGNGAGASPNIGLFAISSQTHEARTVADFSTKQSCGNNIGSLSPNSARGTTVVDPNRNLVYLLARRCTQDPVRPAATVIAINPGTGDATPIDDPVGTPYGPLSAVYNAAGGSVYVYSSGGSVAECRSTSGRISRIVGTAVTGQAPVCGMSNSAGNAAHKVTVLKNFNRVFVAQLSTTDAGTGEQLAPGGLGVTDGTTLLTQSPLGRPHHFGSLAVNNATGKVYAIDPVNRNVAVFRAGSV